MKRKRAKKLLMSIPGFTRNHANAALDNRGPLITNLSVVFGLSAIYHIPLAYQLAKYRPPIIVVW